MKDKVIFPSRLLLLFLGALGVFLEFQKGGASMALYYTVLSNILVTGFVAYLVYLMATKNPAWKSQQTLRLKGGVTMAIMITCVIYHVMLRPIATAADFYRLDNFLCHYIVPIWFLLDTLIFDKNRQYKPLDPLGWTSMPLIYVVFSLFNGLVTKIPIHGAKDSPFPYFFLNGPKNGWDKVALYAGVIFLGYMAFGYAFYTVKSISFGKKYK